MAATRHMFFVRRASISIEKRHPHVPLPVGHQHDGLKPYGLCFLLLPFSIDMNALRANYPLAKQVVSQFVAQLAQQIQTTYKNAKSILPQLGGELKTLAFNPNGVASHSPGLRVLQVGRAVPARRVLGITVLEPKGGAEGTPRPTHFNPNGVASYSPGLRVFALPWVRTYIKHQPQRGCLISGTIRTTRQPPWGCGFLFIPFPRVARIHATLGYGRQPRWG